MTLQNIKSPRNVALLTLCVGALAVQFETAQAFSDQETPSKKAQEAAATEAVPTALAGWTAYQQGDYETALSSFRAAAANGEKLAQYYLGLMYTEAKASNTTLLRL